jgi:hypothetical protein
LPVVNAVAEDYLDEITFLAVAGRSTPEDSEKRVGDWFDPARLLWGYSDDVWALYGVSYQPVSVLVSPDKKVVGGWFGALDEEEMRAELDALAAYAG